MGCTWHKLCWCVTALRKASAPINILNTCAHQAVQSAQVLHNHYASTHTCEQLSATVAVDMLIAVNTFFTTKTRKKANITSKHHQGICTIKTQAQHVSELCTAKQ
jgi:hypothetical protein